MQTKLPFTSVKSHLNPVTKSSAPVLNRIPARDRMARNLKPGRVSVPSDFFRILLKVSQPNSENGTTTALKGTQVCRVPTSRFSLQLISPFQKSIAMRTDSEQEFTSAIESQSEYMDSRSETVSGAVSENDMVAEVVSTVFSLHLLKSDRLCFV